MPQADVRTFSKVEICQEPVQQKGATLFKYICWIGVENKDVHKRPSALYFKHVTSIKVLILKKLYVYVYIHIKKKCFNVSFLD